jgi:hypothetical protein
VESIVVESARNAGLLGGPLRLRDAEVGQPTPTRTATPLPGPAALP